jgi:DNA adenine methylase
MVVLSGYDSALYNEALHDWERRECLAHADGARPRTEVVWLNPACSAALSRARAPLFAVA